MGSTNIYQEGLRLGPTRIVEQGKPIREWFDLLRLNTRMPDASIGDLGAQIAAVRTGERRLSQLLERIGIETYRAACDNIFEQARRMDREAIAAIEGRHLVPRRLSRQRRRGRGPGQGRAQAHRRAARS